MYRDNVEIYNVISDMTGCRLMCNDSELGS